MKGWEFRVFLGWLPHNKYYILRQIFLIIPILVLLSCGHRYKKSKEDDQQFEKRANEKPDTLIVGHDTCIKCLDMSIDQGKLTIPKDLLNIVQIASEKSIRVCGSFPMDLIDIKAGNYNPNLQFKIIGKVIKMDTANGILPLFYVDSWEKFYFDKKAWQSPYDSISLPARKKMVDGIIKNLLFSGQHVSDLTTFLGDPNHIESGEIVYDIEDKYGAGIDPVSSTFFIISFNKDSIVTGKRLMTTNYGR